MAVPEEKKEAKKELKAQAKNETKPINKTNTTLVAKNVT